MKTRFVRYFVRLWAIAIVALLLNACSDEAAQDAESATSGDAASEQAPADKIRALSANVDGARIAAADKEPGNWLSHGRTYDEQRYSPLTDINSKTVKELGLAWYWDTGTKRGLEATPIVVDGVMYTTGAWSVVWAHNAKTGELLWSYDPQVPKEWSIYACCDVVNRGVALWEGKVYVGTLDGRLIALDAGSGEVVWDTLTIPEDRPYTITGAPRIVKGKVIIGNGGAEFGVRGYFSAYDANTGKMAWRFYTVPGDPSKPFENKAMEKAATTWRGGKWWEVGGGGTVWDSMAYDAELNLLYVGVGNGSPWNRYIRSPGGGDNLYVSSILAINPDDGSLEWHYQTTPGDTWDYTATQHIILADIELQDGPRKVLMQAPKNGFFYVLDRVTGEFISAEAYVPVTWASHVDQETGRPVENPEAHYANEAKVIWPAPYGGHNWHPMAFNPNTGLVYIPALDIPFKYGQDHTFKYNKRAWNLGVDLINTAPPKDPDELVDVLRSVKGHLAAWDPVSQKEVWRVQHSQSWNGGLLTTGGNLIFQGRADGTFAAYTADNGELVWESPVGVGIIAAPISYSVGGEQYIAVVAGWGGAFALASGVPRHRDNALSDGRILAYKLGGEVPLPAPNIAYIGIPIPPDMETSDEDFARGEVLYHTDCATCHGPGVLSGGPLPDLRYMPRSSHDAWHAIVRAGAFRGRGMIGFAEDLTAEEADAVHSYVVAMTKGTIALCESEYRKNYPEVLESACVRPSVSAGQ